MIIPLAETGLCGRYVQAGFVLFKGYYFCRVQIAFSIGYLQRIANAEAQYFQRVVGFVVWQIGTIYSKIRGVKKQHFRWKLVLAKNTLNPVKMTG